MTPARHGRSPTGPQNRGPAVPAVRPNDEADPRADVDEGFAVRGLDDADAGARRVGDGARRAHGVGVARPVGPARAPAAREVARKAGEVLPLDHEACVVAHAPDPCVGPRRAARTGLELAKGEDRHARARGQVAGLILDAGDWNAPAPLGSRALSAVRGGLFGRETDARDGEGSGCAWRRSRRHRDDGVPACCADAGHGRGGSGGEGRSGVGTYAEHEGRAS